MFKINRINKDTLDKLDNELIITEINNISNSISTMQTFSLGYLIFMMGYLFNNQEDLIGILLLLFFLSFLHLYNHIREKKYEEYREELYNLAANKKEEKKENAK